LDLLFSESEHKKADLLPYLNKRAFGSIEVTRRTAGIHWDLLNIFFIEV